MDVLTSVVGLLLVLPGMRISNEARGRRGREIRLGMSGRNLKKGAYFIDSLSGNMRSQYMAVQLTVYAGSGVVDAE